jgi:hypothetical protein
MGHAVWELQAFLVLIKVNRWDVHFIEWGWHLFSSSGGEYVCRAFQMVVVLAPKWLIFHKTLEFRKERVEG